MKTTKILKTIIPVLLVALLIGSCDVNDLSRNEFDLDPQVEFDPPRSQQVSEPEDDPNTENINEGASFTVTMTIQLIGPQMESDLQVPFTVSGSGVAGTHFNLLSSSPATISANSSSTTVQVEILEADGDLNQGEAVEVILELQDPGDNITAAENFKEFNLQILGSDAPPVE